LLFSALLISQSFGMNKIKAPISTDVTNFLTQIQAEHQILLSKLEAKKKLNPDNVKAWEDYKTQMKNEIISKSVPNSKNSFLQYAIPSIDSPNGILGNSYV